MSFGDTEAPLLYLKRLELYKHEKPFELFLHIPADIADQRSKNTECEPIATKIYDIRGHESDFTLDDHGFAVRQFNAPLPLLDGIKLELLELTYFPAVENFIRKEVEGVDRVHFFGFRVRSGEVQLKNKQTVNLDDVMAKARPSPIVHIDQGPVGVVGRVRAHLKDESEALLRGRVRVINVWKPIRGPVEDYPLSICDASMMPLSDLQRSDQIRLKYAGETYYGHFNPEQKWYYLSQMKEDEAFLMKIFDSEECVGAKYCPHAAFKHPNAREGFPTRTSIEVRALVFTYPKD